MTSVGEGHNGIGRKIRLGVPSAVDLVLSDICEEGTAWNRPSDKVRSSAGCYLVLSDVCEGETAWNRS